MSQPASGDRSIVSGIILAAGSSVRMGRPKQLLQVRDKPLLQHTLDEAARSCLDELIVVLGHHAAEIERALRLPSRARIVINPEYARGMGTSLAAGLRAARGRASAAAVLLGDQPTVGVGVIDELVARYRSGDAAIVRPVYTLGDGARVPGHPVIVSRRVWPSAMELRGDEGLRSLIAQHPEWLCEVEMSGEPPPDIDTPGDYERTLDTGGSEPG